MTHKMGIPNASDGVSPIGLAREIQERYHGYLRTSFYFRDPLLRRSFEDELAQGQLVNGPFVEATPVYSRETTTSALLAELLGGNVDAGFMAALDPQRRLYVHQEHAVRRLNRGRNVIVATGTGSGKTEAYLLPILLALYRESLLGERAPGVRALILYPMNALANDQRRRLGEFAMRLAARGSKFSFTFGRYTGETPEDERDSFRNARRLLGNRKPGDGELVLRREMRERPPDILLTNYSMLEYLLLRPKDSLLFDNGRGSTWRFCVLDEAHQYRGTKGMEMAMLLRRLKERLREGGLAQRIQCVATSASLGDGPGRRSNLAAFARELFDEPFEEEDVLLENVTRSTTTATVSVPAIDFQALSRVLEAGDDGCEAELQKLVDRYGIAISSESGIAERLHRVLSADHRLAKLRTILDTPRLANDVRDAVFDEVPEDRREEVLEAYLHLVTSARDPESDAPLLTLRYHLFLRALEGAFVRYWPDKRVSLTRAGGGDVSIEGKGDGGSWFEVALCRECGQHYFVGRREGGFLREALRDYGNDDFRVSFFRPVEFSEGDDDAKRARLCVICGALSGSSQRPGDPACGHGVVIDVVEESVRDASEDQMRTCGACEYRGPDPVREIVHGTDGPNAVVATALHRLLPEDRRKVLGFVDGRQEAAFFAVYLERSYQSILGRSLLFATAQSLAKEGYREVSLGSLAARLIECCESVELCWLPPTISRFGEKHGSSCFPSSRPMSREFRWKASV